MVRVHDKELADEIFEFIRDLVKNREVKGKFSLFNQLKKFKLFNVEEGVFSTAHPIEDDAQAPEVTSLVVRLLIYDLRSYVCRCSADCGG